MTQQYTMDEQKSAGAVLSAEPRAEANGPFAYLLKDAAAITAVVSGLALLPYIGDLIQAV